MQKKQTTSVVLEASQKGAFVKETFLFTHINHTDDIDSLLK